MATRKRDPLRSAIELGDADAVRRILQSDGDLVFLPLGKSRYGSGIEFPLQFAVADALEKATVPTSLLSASPFGSSSLDVVETLLKHGAPVDHQDQQGKRALDIVAAAPTAASRGLKEQPLVGAAAALAQLFSTTLAQDCSMPLPGMPPIPGALPAPSSTPPLGNLWGVDLLDGAWAAPPFPIPEIPKRASSLQGVAADDKTCSALASLLVKYGADPVRTNRDGRTCIDLAAESGRESLEAFFRQWRTWRDFKHVYHCAQAPASSSSGAGDSPPPSASRSGSLRLQRLTMELVCSYLAPDMT